MCLGSLASADPLHWGCVVKTPRDQGRPKPRQGEKEGYRDVGVEGGGAEHGDIKEWEGNGAVLCSAVIKP